MRTAHAHLSLVLLLLVSCNKNEVVIDNTGGINVPTVASAQNGFSYFIDAHQFTSEVTMPLIFTCDSLSYALSVSGYSFGKASILIFADSLRYRSSDIVFNTNQAFMFSMMRCAPDSIRLTFSQFSGRMSLALGGIVPHRMTAATNRP